MRIQFQNLACVAEVGQWVLAAAGVVCLSLFLWHEFEARYHQAKLSSILEEQIHDESSRGVQRNDKATENSALSTSNTVQAAADTLGGEIVGDERFLGRLEIQRIGLEVIVLEGVQARTLRRGAGWIPDTAAPGEQGNLAIAGHRDTHFRPLRLVRKGDVVQLTTRTTSQRYQVEWVAVVDPTDTEVLRPTEGTSLTLVTCYPFNYIGRAPKRFIVRAHGVD